MSLAQLNKALICTFVLIIKLSLGFYIIKQRTVIGYPHVTSINVGLRNNKYASQTNLRSTDSRCRNIDLQMGTRLNISPLYRNQKFWNRILSFNIAKKEVSLWGIIFAIQTCICTLPWILGMLLLLPFKLILKEKFDPNGLLIDNLGRVWARLVTFPHTIPRVTGRENLPNPSEPCIYISNHASWLDIPFVGGYLPPVKFVAKQELSKLPVVGQALQWGGHILLDRSSSASRADVLQKCASTLKSGMSVCIFPEGTRSTLPRGEMLPFQKGVFLLAQMAQTRIVPLSLSHSARLMPPGALLPLRPGFGLPRVHIHPAVDTTGLTIKEAMGQVPFDPLPMHNERNTSPSLYSSLITFYISIRRFERKCLQK
eukprot:gene7835-16026_t